MDNLKRLYDVLTGNLLKVLTPHNKEISGLLYCKEDKYKKLIICLTNKNGY